MANGTDILRTYYYNCPPYKSDPPLPDESRRFSAKERFYYALRNLPKFEVREGKLEYRGTDKDSAQPIFQQKRVDIFLAVDLVSLSLKNRITHACILASDSDFIPAVVAAKDSGVIVRLCYSDFVDHSRKIDLRPHRHLLESVDERVVISRPLIDSILRTI